MLTIDGIVFDLVTSVDDDRGIYQFTLGTRPIPANQLAPDQREGLRIIETLGGWGEWTHALGYDTPLGPKVYLFGRARA